ncbi:MAG: ABC transporter [Candidatus Edwardsbacteria bacterium RIFOXYD12_FULL_50_11]|jgi:zinc transport system permease protein|uniref:ABC transporter n=1 Tax=Candidatus Edwardsbacteria bacterium GWF2_54_11 TaxID=1817851 RepID=A0A1F5RD52_9BACT|nr:MAG: ABC transporter [Candidatus Edwardsbacteria bacterium RifOxyC12_full_54_24]OGF07458.1 MAG: ABC transporter [Candidatus Edwardsbacteria bacterium RifOxyA12_full_54_48]OGF09708.1 MAG: ABC transporter [Candidatus Edwardsbacteria bacterium GWE2_54_12]OGF11971.1 MAG: ABC transporter [Candidatus Edwardsbacteria bacterium GWF2_54_11]OGF16656.1 MAG: ABC transporter [Candidatus Edwardsbacteria bacterium RIFOXYD12_FULL_50_11]OGJ19604.1 MAG: ABC transporter [Candidatus Edwardsbacteria bacterium R
MNLWYWLTGLLPFDWLSFAFMKQALLAVILVSYLFGLLGSQVINQQMAFFSDAIGHAALTGIALGAIMGLADPTWAMVIFSGLLALAISWLRRFSLTSTDTVIGLFMAFAVALGIVILSRGGGFARYSGYLVGDILSITPAEIRNLLVLILAVTVLWVLYFNQLMLISLNPSLARSRGIKVWLIEAMFSLVVAVVVTVSIKWVGLLVINSMLILPAAAARNISGNTRQYVWWSIAISLASGISGLIASYYLSTATGATIVLISMGIFVITLGLKKLIR